MRANTNKLNFYVSDAVRKKLERLIERFRFDNDGGYYKAYIGV
mgnify:CR=1 FL=1